MLGAGLLASAADNTVGGTSAAVAQSLSVGEDVAAVASCLLVHSLEHERNVDLRRTARNAVFAGGAGNDLLGSYQLADLQKNILLLLGERHKVLHICHVLLDHLESAHTREHHTHVVKARGKSHSV